MQTKDVRSIAVIGAGLMGHGIAQDFARHGYDVYLYGRRPEGLEQALQNIRGGLASLEKLGSITPDQSARTLERIRIGTVLEEVAAGADLVIEAVSEDLALKREIFRTLGSGVPATYDFGQHHLNPVAKRVGERH